MPTIPSSPATFSNAGPPASQSLTFAIPAGTYVSGYWSETGTTTNGGASSTDEITTGAGNTAVFPRKYATGAFGPLTVAVNYTQLADINAVAGGSLSASFDYNDGAGFGDAISSFTLTLVASAAPPVGPGFECSYAIGYQQSPSITTGFFPAPLLLPGVGNATGYTITDTATGGNKNITLLYDLWTAQTFSTVYFQAGFEGTADVIIEHSADLVTWATLSYTLGSSSSYGGSYTAVTLTADGSGGNTFATGGGIYGTAWYKATVSGTTDRYIRVSMKDSAAGGNTAQIGILSYWGQSGATILGATPHSYSAPRIGALGGSGGLSLSGYYTLLPGNYTGAMYGSAQTDHPGSGLAFTAFENCYGPYAPGGEYPPLGSITRISADNNGAYSYNYSGSDLISLFFSPGWWVASSYEAYMALWYGKPPTGPCYDVVAFGLYDDTTGFPLPDKCVFFAQDPALPEYASIGVGATGALIYSGFFANGGDGSQPPEIRAADSIHASPKNPVYDASLNGYGFTAGTLWNILGIPGEFITGSWSWDLVSSIYANVAAWQRTDGAWNLLVGASITLSDTFGNSETVTSAGISGTATAPPTAANGFFQKINPLAISSVSAITGGTPTAVGYPPSPTGSFPNYKIYPSLGPGVSAPVGSDSYLNETLRTMFWCEVAGSYGSLASLQPRADVFDGIVGLTWVNSDGSLYVAIHKSLLNNVGQGAAGWQTPQMLYSSGESSSAIAYLPTGRCLLIHTTKTEYSDRFGIGTWQNSATSISGGVAAQIFSAGRGEQQGWVFSTGGVISKIQDRAGSYGTWVTFATTGLSGVQYCISFRNGRYLAAGTSTNTLVVAYFGAGTDGAVGAITSGQLVGLVFTASGVVFGLWWDYVAPSTGTKQFYAIRSYDKGFTWIQDSSLIPTDQIPALTIPPALTVIGDSIIAAWASNNVPQFAVSVDCGRTWA